jgi:hypothetical protein
MIRQRTVSIAVLSALTAACGGKNSDVVVITVEADPPGIADIAQLVVSASDGARRAEVTVGDLKMLTIPPAKTIGLSVPSGSPTVVIQVEAVNAMGRSMAFGEATVAMASDGATARVKLEAVASPPPRFSTSADIVAATAGTRLRPIGWAPALASDGPTITVGLTDTTLNFDCLWQVATDGKIRCLPGAYQGAIAYADSQCSQTVLVTTASRCNPAADAGAYGTLFNFNTCPASRSVWRRGEAIVGSLYVRDAANACVVATPPRADQKAWAIDPVEAASLVAATATAVDSGPIVPVMLEAEDGARQFFGWRSEATKADCNVGIAADGKARCLPTPIAIVGTFWTDATCTQPAARTQKSTCTGEGEYVANAANAVCPSATSIFHAGAKQQNAYQRDATNTCSAAALSTSDIYPLGAELLPGMMDAATIGMLPGNQRLRPMTHSTAAGTVVREQFWDAKMRTICSPTAGTNGRTYCLPKVTEPARGFLEQTCSGTAVFLKRVEDCDVSYGAMENTVCPVGKRIFALGAQPLTAGFYTTETGGCAAVMPRGGFQALAAGREIPPEEWVELKRVGP